MCLHVNEARWLISADKVERYLPLAGLRDGSHVEQLTSVILNAAEHHHGDGVALLLDRLQDVLGPQSLFSLYRERESN